MKKNYNLTLKIEKIEKLISEIKDEIKILESEDIETKEKPKKEKKTYSINSFREDFDNLYNEFIAKNSSVVNEFVNEKDIKYLKEFCKSNNISLDSTKTSKDKIAHEITQWFVQRKAISKRI